jgi:hypothetical protein
MGSCVAKMLPMTRKRTCMNSKRQQQQHQHHINTANMCATFYACSEVSWVDCARAGASATLEFAMPFWLMQLAEAL